jgi:methylmalonyl-CoA mutase N-terminal domain/subunit
MRMFAGFGTAEETNERYKYLLKQGNMGLSVAFDLATLMGYDTDAPEAIGEFGKCGVAVSSLKDMEILFDGIPLEKVSTSMTINSPAAIIWAMYIAAAEKQGVHMSKLRGTLQNDILKEFIAQKEYIFPPEPSMRLVVDTIEYGTNCLPQWNTISISGYHIKAKGGAWDGKTCQQPGASTVPQTNPADECRNKGGVWDGKRCRLPGNAPRFKIPR